MSKLQAKGPRMPWLNALVAFEATARLGSLTVAAGELNLTPGAVSRQIKTLEQSLDTTLFARSHNAIALTETGQKFLVHVSRALAGIRAGASEITQRHQTLTVQAPSTLTQRWLIPRVNRFRVIHPDIDLRFLTIRGSMGEKADVEIRHVRGTSDFKMTGGDLFLIDRSQPVCSREYHGRVSKVRRPSDILSFPLILDTPDAWSWRHWCDAAGIVYQPRSDSIVFDTDEAAIDACSSSLGVGQAHTAFIEPLIEAGTLVPLFPEFDAVVGAYYAVLNGEARSAEAFVAWLVEEGDVH